MSRITVFGIAAAAMLVLNVGASAQQPTELRLATWGPPQTYFYTEVVYPWVDAVNRDSHGAIEIKNYPGGTLGHAGNMLDRLLNGVADIGWALQGLTPQVFVKTSVIEVPFSHATGEEGAVALWRTLQKGVIASDYETIEVFGMSAFVGGAIVNRTRPVRTLEDVKGLKLSVAGKIRGEMVTALGAVPLAMPIDEVYQAISRGTVDGNYGAFTAIRQFRTYEVARYFLDEASSGAAAMQAMSKQRFNALPEAARAALRKNSGETFSRALGVSNDGETGRARTFLADLAQQGKVEPVVHLSDQERARWRKVMEPVIDGWVKNVPDGRRVLDAFQAEVAEVRAARAR